MPEVSAAAKTLIYVEAFNNCKGTLAGFSKCQSLGELHTVRDAFMLSMGSKLCPDEYTPVKSAIVTNIQVAAKAGSAGGFEQTIAAARSADDIGVVDDNGGHWAALVAAVTAKAAEVESDLADIWSTLETGRLQWLAARQATHVLKTSLKQAVEEGGNVERDVLEAKMIWIYGLAYALPPCAEQANAWATAAQVQDAAQPLVGFTQDKWDPRVEAWAPLDRGVQAAAEKGGTTLDEEWDAVYTALPVGTADDEVD